MKKVIINTVAGANALKPTTRPAYFDETLDEFKKDQAAERQAQFDAEPEQVLAKLQANDNLLAQSRKAAIRQIRIEDLFSRPSPDLLARCSTRGFYEGTSAEIAKKYYAAAIEGTKGTTLTQSGKDKLVKVFEMNPTISYWNPKNWRTIYDYILDLNAFTPEDGVQAPAPVQQAPAPPAPEPTFAERLEQIDTTTREGEKQAKALLKTAQKSEHQSAAYQFLEQCQQIFGEEPNDAEKTAMARVMDARNLNANDLKGWHTARVLGIRNGFVRPVFATPDDRLSMDVDAGLDTSSFEGRREFMRRSADIAANTTIIPTYPI